MSTLLSSDQKKTTFYYGVLGLAMALAFLVFSYAVLRVNSSLASLFVMNTRAYFYSYVAVTLATAAVFGVNTAFLVRYYRLYGFSSLLQQSSFGTGAVLSIISSSCSVCGSTVLSLIATLSGITAVSSAGLQIKVLSLLILSASAVYSYRVMKKSACTACATDTCSAVRKPIYSKKLLLMPAFIFIAAVFFGARLFATDGITDVLAGAPSPELYSCKGEQSG